MKKRFAIALLAASFIASPAMAGGNYSYTAPTLVKEAKVETEECHNCEKSQGWFWPTTKFIAKLPFRIVSATGKGVYDLITEPSFDGFVEGYELID